MDMQAKSPSIGYPIVFERGDFEAVHYRDKQASMRDIRRLIGGKVIRIILQHYHGVEPKDLEQAVRKTRIIRVIPRENVPQFWGRLIEILYRLDGEKGTYRHVFHFIPGNGGQLNGKLFTQTRRFIAK